jgi:hypothetical protein
MPRTGVFSRLSLRDLTIPAALLVILVCVVAWASNRQFEKGQAARAVQAQELVREINHNIAAAERADKTAERTPLAAVSAKQEPATEAAQESAAPVTRKVGAVDSPVAQAPEPQAAPRTVGTAAGRGMIKKIYSRENARLAAAMSEAE